MPTAGAILDRFLHHATQVVIRGRSYRIKDSPSASLPEENSARLREPSTAEAASWDSQPSPAHLSCRHTPWSSNHNCYENHTSDWLVLNRPVTRSRLKYRRSVRPKLETTDYAVFQKTGPTSVLSTVQSACRSFVRNRVKKLTIRRLNSEAVTAESKCIDTIWRAVRFTEPIVQGRVLPKDDKAQLTIPGHEDVVEIPREVFDDLVGQLLRR